MISRAGTDGASRGGDEGEAPERRSEALARSSTQTPYPPDPVDDDAIAAEVLTPAEVAAYRRRLAEPERPARETPCPTWLQHGSIPWSPEEPPRPCACT